MSTETASEIPCCKCSGPVVEFSIPNGIWNRVMRPDGRETDQEYLCMECWHLALSNWMEDIEMDRSKLRSFANEVKVKICGWMADQECTYVEMNNLYNHAEAVLTGEESA